MGKVSKISGRLFRSLLCVPRVLFKAVFSRFVLFLLTLLICLDVYLETIGLPRSIVGYAESRIAEKLTDCTIGGLRAGIWNGFALYDVRLKHVTGDMACECMIPKVQFRLALLKLMRGRIKPKSILLERGNLKCDGLPGLGELNVNAIRMSFQSTYNDSVAGSIDAHWNGIHILLNARAVGFEDISSLEKISSVFSSSSEEGMNPALEKILRNINEADYGYNNCLVNVSFSTNLNDFSQTNASGSFSIGNTEISGIFITKLHGKVIFREGRVDVEKLFWLLGRNEIVRGEAHYDLARQLVACSASATIFPDTALQLVAVNSLPMGGMLNVRKPISLKFEMPYTKPELDAIKFTAECSMEDAAVSKMDVSGSGFKVKYEKGVIDFVDVNLKLSPDGKELLSGTASLNVHEAKVSCSMKGSLSIGKKLEALGFELPGELKRDLFAATDVSIAIDNSPLLPDELKMKCLLRHPRFEAAPWNVNDIELPIELNKGVLAIKQGSFSLQGSANATGLLNAELNLLEYIKSKRLKVTHRLSLAADSHGGKAGIVDWEGSAVYDFSNEDFTCTGKLSAFLDRFYTHCLKDLGPDIGSYCKPFRCEELPYLCETEIKIPANGHWSVSGKITGQKGCGYGTLICRQATTSLNLNAKSLSFKNIEGTLLDGSKVALSIGMNFTPFLLEIDDLKVTGDPMVANNFIFSSQGQKIYSQIWEDIRWGKENPPTISIPRIKYYSDDASISWGLVLEKGSIDAKNFQWRSENVNSAILNLEMNLPEEVVLPKIHLNLDAAEFEGSCKFAISGVPYCSFKVDKLHGALDMRGLLLKFSPELDSVLPDFKIGNDTLLDCEGSSNLFAPYQLEMSGKVKSDSIAVMGVVANELNGEWSYKNDVVRVSLKNSKLMGGTFSGGFSYDNNQRCGDFIGQCKGISLERILQVASQDEKASYPGVVSANCSLRYHLGWGSKQRHFNGLGHISIKDSDIWRVPVINGLGRTLNFAAGSLFRKENAVNIGKISRADANVAFAGTRLMITDFRTDGTLLALQGSGQYLLDEDAVDFTVNSKILRKINVISLLFRPLTGSFYATLKGPRREAKWKVSTFLGRMLTGE